MIHRAVVTVLSLAFLVAGPAACKSAGEHAESLGKEDADRLTVGSVQKNVKVGMSGAEVAETLGSPNIVTTDDQRREVWIYDRIATERVESSSEGGLFLVIAGVGQEAGAARTSQRTLTVIVKFDENGKVRDYAYHTSRF
jgi:outer membrane protein assembly factor BamE (lipoprotein component of BamABCDE complex)